MTTEAILVRVLRRIGDGDGLQIHVRSALVPSGRLVEVRWRRSYDGVLSDERIVTAHSLHEALGMVLDREDQADDEDRAGKPPPPFPREPQPRGRPNPTTCVHCGRSEPEITLCSACATPGRKIATCTNCRVEHRTGGRWPRHEP